MRSTRTGTLLIGGAKVFPLGLSNAPPLGGTAPGGKDGLKELAAAGATFIRTGRGNWSPGQLDAQLAAERAQRDAAAAHGLHCWLYLGEVADLPPRTAGQPPSATSSCSRRSWERSKTTRRSAPTRASTSRGTPSAAQLDPSGRAWCAPTRAEGARPDHPLVIIQAPRSPVAQLTPYRPAFDITGADIFPIAYPPGEHSDLPNRTSASSAT